MAGKGGGAWKVAYADFVTAMMAFFLVMWICGQDQKIKRAVSYYFNDPFGASNFGTSRKPMRSGSVSEMLNAGSLPSSESVALGRGRNPFSAQVEFGAATKLVADSLQANQELSKYWQAQAIRQRDLAKQSPETQGNKDLIDKLAVRELAKQLKDELVQKIPPDTKGVYHELLHEIIAGVNWDEIAEELIGR